MTPIVGQGIGLTTTLAALAVIIPIELWVYLDASDRERHGRPVTAQVGSLDITTATQWLAACIVMMLLFLPLYMAARRVEP